MVKVSKYEFFENGYAQMALEVGEITPSAFMKFIHYKVFLQAKQDGHNKTTAVQIAADSTNCSFSTAYRSIQHFLKGD